MPASLSFKKQDGTDATALSEVEIVALKDYTGNEYTLDITNELKVKYTPRNGNTAEYTVNGLASALESVLNMKNPHNHDKMILTEAVEKKEVVDAITASSDFAKNVYTKTTADTAFVKTADLEKQAVAGKVLGAKDGDKSILVEKLGVFLDKTDETDDKVYGAVDHKKIAKDFLDEKGLKPTAAEVAAETTLQSGVATQLLDSTNKDKLGRAILDVKKRLITLISLHWKQILQVMKLYKKL